MRPGEIRACSACSKAKRKCDKQLPSCQRCQDKNIKCNYSAQPSVFVYGVDIDQSHGGDSMANMSVEAYALCPNSELNLLGGDILGITDMSPGVLHPSMADLQSAWFLTPETWTVHERESVSLSAATPTVLHRMIRKTQAWLQEWVCTGSNAFIHSQLYKTQLPGCIQDTFMAASSYLSRTPETEEMIFRIIDERSCQLVRSKEHCNELVQDPFESMSRLHALLMYQIIRLFDGEIRQKHLARKHIPLLRSWASEMLQCTAEAARNGNLLASNRVADLDSPMGEPSTADQEKLLWHAWILSESVRRTWIVSQSVGAISTILLDGRVECPGGLMFTTRKGVWEAKSALSWIKLCAERNVGFMHRNEIGRILSETSPGEVNDLGHMMLELDFGLDVMERWGVDINQPL
ncbi:hypothetical protein BGZ63DRAFT_269964 [Mariannaea sp. PMI_226]|nr:hypothetical protein BGZ63DRAFT_269964 [Mariannaea sp. PMI_226]